MHRTALMIPLLCALAGPAQADAADDARRTAPEVVTDIAPVQSLVARVMEGVGTPDLLLPPGASPHGYAMRPSEAAALESADLVVWIGPRLTPWLADAVATLAGDAETLELLDVEGTLELPFGEGRTLATDEDDHGHGDEDHHGHEAGHEHEHEHGGSGLDPHAWLDPMNARIWLTAIAAKLAAIDPPNAARYHANAVTAEAEISALTGDVERELAPVRDTPFIVFHDAYQYFGHRFGVEAAGAVAASDAARPGPRRITAIRELIERTGAVCLFTEPQFPASLVATVTEGTAIRPGILDPLGATLAPGPEHYARMMRALAANLRACLDPDQ